MKQEDYVTADTHFGHKAMLNYRPFQTVEEMDEALIEAWNRKVPYNAVVYHLGDFSFLDRARTEMVIARLNGRIRLVLGNHDRRNVKGSLRTEFDWVKDYYESKGEAGQKIVMCHYAFKVWNGHHYGSWNLHGHSHGNLREDQDRRLKRRQLDVGVDARKLYGLDWFEPWSYQELEREMRDRGFVGVDHHAERG